MYPGVAFGRIDISLSSLLILLSLGWFVSGQFLIVFLSFVSIKYIDAFQKELNDFLISVE